MSQVSGPKWFWNLNSLPPSWIKRSKVSPQPNPTICKWLTSKWDDCGIISGITKQISKRIKEYFNCLAALRKSCWSNNKGKAFLCVDVSVIIYDIYLCNNLNLTFGWDRTPLTQWRYPGVASYSNDWFPFSSHRQHRCPRLCFPYNK